MVGLAVGLFQTRTRRELSIVSIPDGDVDPDGDGGCAVGTTALASAQTAPATAGAIGSAPRAKATLDQVAWIAGPWEGMLGDRKIEQHWMAPAANSMVAMYRPEGSRDMLELLAIEQDGEALILRISTSCQDRGSPDAKRRTSRSTMRSCASTDARRSSKAGAENPSRVTFTSPNPDTLTITVERMRDGKLVPTDFKYSRIKS